MISLKIYIYIYVYIILWCNVKYYSTYTNNIFIHNIHCDGTRYRIAKSITDHRWNLSRSTASFFFVFILQIFSCSSTTAQSDRGWTWHVFSVAWDSIEASRQNFSIVGCSPLSPSIVYCDPCLLDRQVSSFVRLVEIQCSNDVVQARWTISSTD